MSDIDVEETTETDTFIEKAASAVVGKVRDGSISLSDLLKALAPAPERIPAPVRVPLPAKISDSQREALDRLPDVFGKVVPTERRSLQPVEVTALLDERGTLDEIAKLAEDRKAAIRTTIFNHLDVLVEEEGVPEDALYDKDGHYVIPGDVRDDGSTPKRFTREVSNRGPSLTANDLEALEAEGEITHEDFLAMTTQTRVLDEAKVMLHLRAKPQLVRAIAKATKPGAKVAAMYVRKA